MCPSHKVRRVCWRAIVDGDGSPFVGMLPVCREFGRAIRGLLVYLLCWSLICRSRGCVGIGRLSITTGWPVLGFEVALESAACSAAADEVEVLGLGRTARILRTRPHLDQQDPLCR